MGTVAVEEDPEPRHVARRQALRLAARPGRARRCRSSPGAWSKLTGLGVFWFFGPVLVFGDLPAARPADRDGRRATRPTA